MYSPAPRSSHGPYLLLCLCAGALHGCVVGVRPPPTQAEASQGPPPRVHEAPPRAATAAGVWIDGYWHYDGMRHVWVPGRWQKSVTPHGWSAR